jgi:hypothetical protein
VMSAGLLPDGQPYGDDDMDNSARIEGPAPAQRSRADACVWTYMPQQNLLGKEDWDRTGSARRYGFARHAGGLRGDRRAAPAGTRAPPTRELNDDVNLFTA